MSRRTGRGKEPNPSRHTCHSLPSSTSNHSEGLSACLITETCRRSELNGWGRRLFVYVCHLFVDQQMSFGDRERSNRALLAELWRVFSPQPSELALPAAHLRGSSCQSRSSSEIHSHAVINLARQGRRLMRRTSRGGWLSRLAAKRQKVGLGTPSSNRKTENQTKARRLRHANAGPNTGPRYAGYCAARGRARILLLGCHPGS